MQHHYFLFLDQCQPYYFSSPLLNAIVIQKGILQVDLILLWKLLNILFSILGSNISVSFISIISLSQASLNILQNLPISSSFSMLLSMSASPPPLQRTSMCVRIWSALIIIRSFVNDNIMKKEQPSTEDSHFFESFLLVVVVLQLTDNYYYPRPFLCPTAKKLYGFVKLAERTSKKVEYPLNLIPIILLSEY